ncbi:MAG: GntR family transcriptional regulator [Bacillota bacterium]|nr:GntR family transcriptional regulator [Bacillota bacterium]
MAWNLDDSRPIWPQIKDILTRDILSGKYEMGGHFPTVRDLAETAQVNRNTMQRALSELENDGIIISNRTAGRTVTTDEKLLSDIRKSIAGQSIETFKSEMAQLGFTLDEVIAMMKENNKE